MPEPGLQNLCASGAGAEVTEQWSAESSAEIGLLLTSDHGRRVRWEPRLHEKVCKLQNMSVMTPFPPLLKLD